MSNTLFGAPLALDAATLEQWVRILSRSWIALMGDPPGDLEADLSALAPVFASGAKPRVLKEKVYSLPVANAEDRLLPADALAPIDGGSLITPEGRILLDVLLDLQRSGHTAIDVSQQVRALQTAIALRTRWQRTWLKNQFQGTLSAPPLGAALFLLINGSIGPEAAFILPSADGEDRQLGQIVLPLVARFSERLGGRVPETSGGVRKHWAFTQVSRILGRDVAREPAVRGTTMYIRPDRQAAFLDEVASRLARLADIHRRREAVTGLVDGYREIRGELAAFGQMHEDPTATRRIIQRVADPMTDPRAGGS
ncbi:hypothetical protein ACGFJC_39830 [Nonomuraea fuscirosea]|uniref:hypothetical protein n=1 Tax=Nonomuraea fuscirosea TaxID=1291556 RepID=UPI003712C066